MFQVNLYFFCGCANFLKKMKSPRAKFESFGLCIPGNFLVTLYEKMPLC